MAFGGCGLMNDLRVRVYITSGIAESCLLLRVRKRGSEKFILRLHFGVDDRR